MFGYDANTDCYVATGNHNEVIMYQVGEDYIVTTYIEERGTKEYVGNNLDLAIETAVNQAENHVYGGQ